MKVKVWCCRRFRIYTSSQDEHFITYFHGVSLASHELGAGGILG